jgi:hypothetical protein
LKTIGCQTPISFVRVGVGQAPRRPHEGDRIVLRFADKGYSVGGRNARSRKVTVYGFFVLPRSTKTVVLEEQFRTMRSDQPPLREERIRLPDSVGTERRQRAHAR